MSAGRVNRLPVVDATGALCGIVTRSNVVRVVAQAYDGAARRDQKQLAGAL
ncbi:MAG: CBS domain-containing protein [Actinomycetota bacterium]|nr:CBS domain-containing protein [Actinomycetota bacterium]